MRTNNLTKIAANSQWLAAPPRRLPQEKRFPQASARFADERAGIMGLLKIHKLTVTAVTFALYAAQETRGNSPYLTQSGPPPLRFSVAMASMASFALPASLFPHSAATNATEAVSSKSITSQTNSIAPLTPLVTSPANNLFLTTGPEPLNNSAITPSASDMLVVSPQMLTEYFKPGPEGTNSGNSANSGNAVILPVAVGFTPPSAKPSSQATYKVQ